MSEPHVLYHSPLRSRGHRECVGLFWLFVLFTRSYTITYVPINSPWDVTEQNKACFTSLLQMLGDGRKDWEARGIEMMWLLFTNQASIPVNGRHSKAYIKNTWKRNVLFEKIPFCLLFTHQYSNIKQQTYLRTQIDWFLSPCSPCNIWLQCFCISLSQICAAAWMICWKTTCY